MACLALSLQPVNGPDVLLQTREWFPPARAALASYSFRVTRLAYANKKHDTLDGLGPGLGDEALAASSGQVVVGKESKFRVVYRLVNSIYVLGITSADLDDDTNVYECVGIVNQAVNVLVAACKGVDVTSEKISRKYTEVYMALDVILHGVSVALLSTIMATFHGESGNNLIKSAADIENKARGAESWNQVKVHSLDRLSNVEVLSNITFELPEETLAAGDETAAAVYGTPQQGSGTGTPGSRESDEKPNTPNEDPFAASDAIVTPESDLAGKFQKSKDGPTDVIAGLSDLTVPTIPLGGDVAESTTVSMEGFEGEYGGVSFEDEAGGFGTAFEGLNGAFGGGLDASEFGAKTSTKDPRDKGLGGLELLAGGPGTSGGSQVGQSTPGLTPDPRVAELAAGLGPVAGSAVQKEAAITGPVMWLTEEINAEFEGLTLIRVGLQGSLQLQTPPPSRSANKEIEFSFSLKETSGIKRAIVRGAAASSVGKGVFHVRTRPSEQPMTILKYYLQPNFTPVPLRFRVLTQRTETALSVMVQYVANPHIAGELKDVIFKVALPFAPITLKSSPRATLNRNTKEVLWHIPSIEGNAPPQALRAQVPLDSKAQTALLSSDEAAGDSKEPKLSVAVVFSCSGQTLSGISVAPITEGSTDFTVGEHTYKAGRFLCS